MFALVCGMQLWAQNEEIPVQEDEYQVLVRQIDARALGLPEVQAEDTAAEEEAEVSAEADTLPFVHPLPVLEPVRMRAAAPAASACPVDSIVGRDPEGKYVTLLAYRYDSKDREVESASWQWVDGKKTGVSKSEKEFYEDGKQKMTATWTWDAEKGDWRGSSKNEYEYDASGHTVNWVVSQWDGNDWIGQKRTTYTYNASGKTLESVEYVYDKDKGDWTGSTKIENTYDSSNRTLVALTSVWSTTAGDWVPQKKYEKEYDEAGNMTLDLYYSSYDEANAKWIGNYKKIYIYNASKKKLLDEQYTWDAKAGDWKGSAKTEWNYNAAGKTTMTLKYKWANSAWTYNTKSEVEFDEKNRETDNASYTWKNDAWQGSKRTATTYTDAGKTETKTVFAWKEGAWVNSTLTGYVYSGSLTTEEYTKTWDGTDWQNNTRKTIEYNAAKKKETEITCKWSDGDWLNQTKVHYTYNAKGVNTIVHNAAWTDGKWTLSSSTRTDIEYNAAGKETMTAKYTCGADSVWSGTQKDEWGYNEAGTMVYRAAYEYGDADWVPSYKIDWVYDGSRKLEEKRLNYSNGNWLPYYWYQYDYDKAGHEVLNVMYNGSGTEWVGMSKTEREYGEDGQIAREMSYTWRNDRWEGVFRTSYVYDDKKRETDRTLERYDAETGEWYYDTRNIHEYNGSGLEVKANEYKWLDGAWVFVVQSEKEYDKEDSKLRTLLEVTYKDGVMQVYNMKQYHYACDPKYYTVRFLDWDGKELQSEKLLEGAKPEYKGDKPERAADAQYTYTFAGWDKEIAAVAGEASYTATYSSTLNRYTVTFYDEDGTTKLWSGEFDYGTTPAYGGSEPEKTADAQYTYTFAGWDKEIVAVAGEASYTATYSSTLNRYTVTFYDEDGTTKLWSGEFDYGTTPVYGGSEPEKTADAQYTYTFAGWDKEIAAVAGEASYTATYSSTLNRYTVTFYDEDGTKILWKEVLDYGATPVYKGEKPMKEGNQQYSYSFMGWDEDIVPVTGDAVYKAVFMQNINKFTVTFRDADGVTELQSQNYEYGQVPVYEGVTPTKTGDAQYSYVFDGWDKEITAVTEYTVYTAQYKEVVNEYLVTFYDEDGTTVLWSGKFEYGATAVYGGTTPATTGDAQYSHVFKGWDRELGVVTGEASYTAQYEDVLNMYRITFYDEDGETVLDSREWEYGSTPAYMGTTPVKAEDENNTYSFSGWNKEIAAVTGEASYTASYTATAKTPTSIGGMQETAPKAVKVVENGVMYIIIDGVKYDATGVVIN